MRLRNLLIKLGLVLLLVATVWALIAAVDRTMSSRAETIVYNLKGDKDSKSMVSEDDLRVIMDREFNDLLVGTELSEVNIQSIEERLTMEPYLAEVDVYVDAKGILNIEARPRVALMRVMHLDGRSYFIDVNGIMFPVSRHYTPRVHVITGKVPVYQKPLMEEDSAHAMKQIFDLINYLKTDEFLDAQIEEVHIRMDGNIELVPKVGSHRIIYGRHDAKDMADRFENLKVFYQEGLPYEGWNKYSSINIEYKGQVVCSKK